MRKQLTVFLVGLAVTTAAACSRATSAASPNPRDNIVVRVRNDAFWDARIYLVKESTERIRIGIANGNSTTILPVSRAILSGMDQVRFFVNFIGSNARDVSESILAEPGDTIELQIRE